MIWAYHKSIFEMFVPIENRTHRGCYYYGETMTYISAVPLVIYDKLSPILLIYRLTAGNELQTKK